MSYAFQRRRGTTADHAGFTGLDGETTVDTDKKVVVVHDGSTAGGFPLAQEADVVAAQAAAEAASLPLHATADDSGKLGGVTPSGYGLTLIDDVDASTARTTLGLGTLATQSGTFSGTSSGTNTGDQTSVSGNAGTATALQTARNINGVAFDGTAPITVAADGSTLTGTTLAAGLIGTTGTTACAGNDSRLSNARAPTAHHTSHQDGGSDEIATATPGAGAIPKASGAGTLDSAWIIDATTVNKGVVKFGTGAAPQACVGNDARLSDARTPTAHATSHNNGGSDEIATATAGANAIPKAGAGGTLAAAWVQEVLALADLTDVTSKTGTGTVVVMDTAPTINAPTFGAGSASASSWPKMTAGTLLTTAEDGAIELDADCFYGCTDAGNRGYIPVRHFIRADATRNTSSDTNLNAVFNSPANGRVTLETGAYRFECLLQYTAMSATSGNALFDILGAGTATLGALLWVAKALDATTATTPATAQFSCMNSKTTGAAIATAGTGTGLVIEANGTFEVTGAGTLIPSLKLLTAATATLSVGSYFLLERIGSTSVVSVGQWD